MDIFYLCLIKYNMKLVNVLYSFIYVKEAFSFTQLLPFWYPIASSKEVSNKVVHKFYFHDQPISIIRLNHTHVSAFHDYCVHRGASFDKTVVKNHFLECPYHGFQFEADTGILEHGLGVTKGCSALNMIPCIEKDGLVFIKPVPGPLLEDHTFSNGYEYNDASFTTIHGSGKLKCDADQLLYNLLDPLHISTIHVMFRNRDYPEPIEFKSKRVNATYGESRFHYKTPITSPANFLSKAQKVDVHNYYHLPMTVGSRVIAGNDIKTVHVNIVQRRLGETQLYWSLSRNFFKHGFISDILVKLIMEHTLSEDRGILERCNSKYLNGPINSKYDSLQLYRRNSMKKKME